MDTSGMPRTVDPGECRCCGLSKKCRIINKVYDFKGNNEVYWYMMLETFDISISHVENDIEDRLICATCVVRLRDAYNFKKQVKQCDENFTRVLEKRHKKLLHPKIEVDPVVNANRFLKHQDHDREGSMELDDVNDEDDDSCPEVTSAPEKIDPLESRVNKCKNDGTFSVDNETKPSDSLLERLLLGNKESVATKRKKVECAKDDLSDNLDTEPSPVATLVKDNNAVHKKRTLSKLRDRPVPEHTEDENTSSLLKKLLTRADKKSSTVKKRVRKDSVNVELRVNKTRAPPATQKPSSKRRMRHATPTERLSYDNLITIVTTSHVCPFKNITAHYYCFYCRDNFTDPQDLRRHTSTHDPSHFESYLKAKYMTKLDITRLDCRICDATSSSLDELKQHIRSHGIEVHDAPDMFVKFRLTHPKVECLECGQSFLFIDKLMEHLPVHFGKHVCDQCGAAFIQSSSLESHIRAHSIKGKGYPCSICGRVLCSVRVRKVHEMRVHAKKPVIDCLKCDEKFTTYNQRNKHLVSVHGDNRTIPCPYCGKEFESRNAFRTHNVTVHVREEKFQCAVCFQKFMLSKQLSKHKKRCHPADADTGVM